MNDKDSFKEFINNSYTKKFFEYYETELCSAVNTISAVCEEIIKDKSRMKSGELNEMIGYIFNQCAGLMRTSELSATLRKIAEDSDEEVMDIKHFLDFFVGECNSVTENTCKLSPSMESGIMVKIQRSVISYVMLEFIRCYALKYGKNTFFDISCVRADGEVRVAVTVEVPENENPQERNIRFNFFKDHFERINEILTEKSGVRYDYKENSMMITIPQYTGKMEFDFLNRQIVENKGKFSAYHIMLDDINDYIQFD